VNTALPANMANPRRIANSGIWSAANEESKDASKKRLSQLIETEHDDMIQLVP
jgi:hypothetical protein